jgi:hypothetical protein
MVLDRSLDLVGPRRREGNNDWQLFPDHGAMCPSTAFTRRVRWYGFDIKSTLFIVFIFPILKK